MKMTIHSTSEIVERNGAKGRVWEGVTEKGVKVYAHITLVACHRDDDAEEFERDLKEVTPPSRDALRAIDPRFII